MVYLTCTWPIKGAFVWEYSGIRIYSGIYSGYSAPGSRIAGMEIQVFRNRKSNQTNASGLIPNKCTLNYEIGFVSQLQL